MAVELTHAMLEPGICRSCIDYLGKVGSARLAGGGSVGHGQG